MRRHFGIKIGLLLNSFIPHSFNGETSSMPFGLPIKQEQQQQQWNESLHNVLLTAERDLDCLVNDMFSTLSLPLAYSIFKGRSALRDLPPE
eukprot:14972576-Ditylum_brightwellii.AAC.1